LINNRQGGRRRGRGGPRGPNLGGGGQPGNRQDNRQRGNAAQLLEKYKSMARDSQLAGDRVQTEYFLQFADHYFRVLGESRSRFDEQRPRRDHDIDEDADNSSSENEHGFQHGDEDMVEAGDESAADERPERPERPERQDRGERSNQDRRPQREARGGREAAKVESDQYNGGGETIPFDVLPPAIGRDESASADAADEEPRRPRRRTRAPRPAEDDGEAAPAA
jgi:hypothetical protein